MASSIKALGTKVILFPSRSIYLGRLHIIFVFRWHIALRDALVAGICLLHIYTFFFVFFLIAMRVCELTYISSLNI